METVGNQMIAKRRDSVDYVVKSKTQKKHGPIIITVQSEAGLDILGEYFLQIRETMDENIAFYPFIVIPEKRISQIEGINKKTNNYQPGNEY